MDITTFPGGTVLVTSGESAVIIDPHRNGPFFRRFPDWGDLAESRDILLTGIYAAALKDVPPLLEALDGTVYCSEKTAEALEKKHGNPDRIVVARPGVKLIIDALTVTVCEGGAEGILSFEISDGTDRVTLFGAFPEG